MRITQMFAGVNVQTERKKAPSNQSTASLSGHILAQSDSFVKFGSSQEQQVKEQYSRNSYNAAVQRADMALEESKKLVKQALLNPDSSDAYKKATLDVSKKAYENKGRLDRYKD